MITDDKHKCILISLNRRGSSLTSSQHHGAAVARALLGKRCRWSKKFKTTIRNSRVNTWAEFKRENIDMIYEGTMGADLVREHKERAASHRERVLKTLDP